MARGTLSKEKIIQATIEIAEEKGLDKVNFKSLADYFQIKAPSLYNHFKNMTEVRIASSIYLQNKLNEQLIHAMVGLAPHAAILAYAKCYRTFAEENSAAYELLNSLPQIEDQELSVIFNENIALLRTCLENFNLSDEEITQRSRMIRSTLHGYLSLSQLGYFQSKETQQDSFDYMVERLISDLTPATDFLEKYFKE